VDLVWGSSSKKERIGFSVDQRTEMLTLALREKRGDSRPPHDHVSTSLRC
jgi:hypothetical protein